MQWPGHVAMGTMPRPCHACCQGKGSPMGTRYVGTGTLPHTIPCQVLKLSTKDSAYRSVGIILRYDLRYSSAEYSRHTCCQGQGSPIGMQPRRRHAAAKVKARCHGHTAKAKACMLLWPGWPYRHAADAKASITMGGCVPKGLPWPWLHALFEYATNEHAAKAKVTQWACC